MPRVALDGQTFEYVFQPLDGSYEFEVEGAKYRFRQWTWGEKNRVTDTATIFEPDTGRLRIDIAQFNESMLATTPGGRRSCAADHASDAARAESGTRRCPVGHCVLG